jgi:hypothetical protein
MKRYAMGAIVALAIAATVGATERDRAYRPTIQFRDFPQGRAQAGQPAKYGYHYYPYSKYRSDYPRDRYDRSKSGVRYPVR